MTIASLPTATPVIQDNTPSNPTTPNGESFIGSETTTNVFSSAFDSIERYIRWSDDFKTEDRNNPTESRKIIITDSRGEQKRRKYQLAVVYDKSHRLSTVRFVDDEVSIRGESGKSLEINRTFDGEDNAIYGRNFSDDMLPEVIRDIKQVAVILSTAAGDRNSLRELADALSDNKIAISVLKK